MSTTVTDSDSFFDDVDDIFGTPSLPARVDPGPIPHGVRRFVVSDEQDDLARKVIATLRAASPASWWWEIAVMGSGALTVSACPRDMGDRFTDIGTIQIDRHGRIVAVYGAARPNVARLRGNRAYSVERTHHEAPAELVEVADALSSAVAA